MILYVAKSRQGWSVLSGADALEEFARIEEARSFASELRDEAIARGESAILIEVAEAGDPSAKA